MSRLRVLAISNTAVRRHLIIIRTGLVLVFAGTLAVRAQSLQDEGRLFQTNPFVCRTWRTKDGLPQDSVSAIVGQVSLRPGFPSLP